MPEQGANSVAFKIGISMAGAISAGAYTAGVLDFLTEALDAWQVAKDNGESVLLHDVSLEVLSGASAGGMCAAISAVMLREDFEHIHDTSKTGTTNRFYESWVNRIDIRELLKTEDLKKPLPVRSLLDSTIIGEIASYTLTPGVPLPTPRAYVSPDLTLFLSLTNLRGTPYSLNGAAPGSLEETTFFFGDRIRFESVGPGKMKPIAQSARALDATKSGAAGGWDVLQTAAAATGAFPLFLAPRVLSRYRSEYTPPVWESVSSAATGTPPPISPNFPTGTPNPLDTLNVDGGVTNNDPFNYANDYLATLAPELPEGKAGVSATSVDRAVISVAPFPTIDKFDVKYDPLKNSSIFSIAGRLFTALISQSRFFGESLNLVMSGSTFGRFVIAPSDAELAAKYEKTPAEDQPPALQCATLGAFGGFFDRGFRAHDYDLGRRNCQKFLTNSFVLPEANVIIKAGLERLTASDRASVIQRFKQAAPGAYDNEGNQALPVAQRTATNIWLPVIPLCTEALRQPIAPVPRAAMGKNDLDLIVTLILLRFKKVMSVMLAPIPSWTLRVFLRIGQPFIRFLAKKPLRTMIIEQLGDSYRP